MHPFSVAVRKWCVLDLVRTYHPPIIDLLLIAAGKGQLISKGHFGVIVWTKKPTNLFEDFCPSDPQRSEGNFKLNSTFQVYVS